LTLAYLFRIIVRLIIGEACFCKQEAFSAFLPIDPARARIFVTVPDSWPESLRTRLIAGSSFLGVLLIATFGLGGFGAPSVDIVELVFC